MVELDKKADPVYGQLYKLDKEVEKKKLNGISLKNNLAILGYIGKENILKHGELVPINKNLSYYGAELFTRTVFSRSIGSTLSINGILKNLIDKKVDFGGDESQKEKFSLYAQDLMKFKSTRNKLEKGDLICNPNLDNQFLLYLGQDNWLKIGMTLNHAHINVLFGLRLLVEKEMKQFNRDNVINIPANEVLHKGVLIDKFDLSKIRI